MGYANRVREKRRGAVDMRYWSKIVLEPEFGACRGFDEAVNNAKEIEKANIDCQVILKWLDVDVPIDSRRGNAEHWQVFRAISERR